MTFFAYCLADTTKPERRSGTSAGPAYIVQTGKTDDMADYII